MCFTKPLSGVLAAAGVVTTAALLYLGAGAHLIAPAVLYTVMEATQFAQYHVIDRCEDPVNVNLTRFTWFLEWIQPIMWNAIWWSTTTRNAGVFAFTTVLSVVGCALAMLRICVNQRERHVTHELQVRGETCAKTGRNHIKWHNNAATYHGMEPNWYSYLILWFLPLFWLRPVQTAWVYAASFVTGIVITSLMRPAPSEIPSTWCLLSIPTIVIPIAMLLK